MSKWQVLRRVAYVYIAACIAGSSLALAQQSVTQPPANELYVKKKAEQLANILGLSEALDRLHAMRAQTPCGSPPTVELLAARQDIFEAVVSSSLEVDGVLAELESERARLSDLQTALASRRDKSLGLLNVANLITGTGLGIVTNALQFSDSTAKIGDNIGVVSGVGSTVLSVVSIRHQRGPQHTVGRVPNMLAPLFGREAVLNSYYPAAVLEYLNSAPTGQVANGASRFDQLMSEWMQAGRIGPAGSKKADQQISRLTSSLDNRTKLSIDDISDRIAMLSDITGRVGLMKRDLAALMRSMQMDKTCLAD